MNEAKPFASLGPTLLARKGGARPAMRSQLGVLQALDRSPETHNEDLGWNDMGEEHSADVLQMNPANESGSESEVRRQQESISAKFNPTLTAKRAPAKTRRSALDDGRRAAFTLRVDSERHLKLRLACTIRNRSAQQLVTEALDRLLAEMPDLEQLAGQVQRK
jgi:hypothetical protein